MKRALLIAWAGDPDGDDRRLAEAVRGRMDYDLIAEVFLGSGGGALADRIAWALASGASQVVVVPYFLSLAPAVRETLLRGVEEARQGHPGVEIALADPVGADDRMADIVCDRARAAEMGLASAQGRPALIVDGLVRRPLSLTYADLRAIPGQVEDVGALAPGRQGAGLRVEALLKEAGPAPSAGQISFHSADGEFEASLSLAEAQKRGILIYRLNEDPLPERMGGPVRLVVPGTEDACNNVKRVVRVEIKA